MLPHQLEESDLPFPLQEGSRTTVVHHVLIQKIRICTNNPSLLPERRVRDLTIFAVGTLDTWSFPQNDCAKQRVSCVLHRWYERIADAAIARKPPRWALHPRKTRMSQTTTARTPCSGKQRKLKNPRPWNAEAPRAEELGEAKRRPIIPLANACQNPIPSLLSG